MGFIKINGVKKEIPSDEEEILRMKNINIFKNLYIDYKNNHYEIPSGQDFNTSAFNDNILPKGLKNIILNFKHQKSIVDESGKNIVKIFNIAKIIKKDSEPIKKQYRKKYKQEV